MGTGGIVDLLSSQAALKGDPFHQEALWIPHRLLVAIQEGQDEASVGSVEALKVWMIFLEIANHRVEEDRAWTSCKG